MKKQARMKKPSAGDNSFLGITVVPARIQIINEETNTWQTVGQCIDTPNAIRNEIAKPEYKGLSLWLWTALDGRRPLF